MRLMLLCALVVLSLGCGGSGTGTVPTGEAAAGEGMNQLRDLMVEASSSVAPLKKKGDVAEFEGRYPAAVAGVNDGSLTIVWGKGIREGIGEDAEVIAHQTTPGADGVWVVLENSELKKLTNDEFKAQKGK